MPITPAPAFTRARATRIILGTIMYSTALASTALSAELALKRTILGAGGVGYFEYVAEVNGDETIAWRARIDQVDDILKSMVVMDEAGPAVVTLPGKASLQTAFASLPFNEGDVERLPSLIAALQGAEISVEAPRKLSGRIVNAVTETVKDKDDMTVSERTRVSLIADGKIEQFILEQAEGLTFSDKTLGDQVNAALSAVRSNRDRSGRDIAIRLAKGGKRIIRVGIVTEAPVWKAAYRLSLPKKGESKGRLQGWVVLENMTGNPWKDVTVTLSAASPVTFRQSLYEPYYVARPELAPPVSRTAMPRMDHGQMTLEQQAPVAAAVPMDGLRRPRLQTANGAKVFKESMDEATSYEASPALGSLANTSESTENVAGSSFTLSAPVSVGAGESMTMPFTDLPIEAESIAWFQAGIAGRNAWHAVSVKNGGDVTLPAGSVTLYEDTKDGPLFSGEAQLAILPAGENRLLGFGADQKVTVGKESEQTGRLVGMKAVKGIVTIEKQLRWTTKYRIKNTSDQPRRIVLEHARNSGWQLQEPAKDKATLAGDAYRIQFDVPANETKTQVVTLERPIQQSIAIDQLTTDWIGEFLSAPEIDDATRAKFAPVASLVSHKADLDSRIESMNGQKQSIVEDQGRLRENLRAVPNGSDLARLYSQKLLDQEKNLDKLETEIAKAKSDLNTARNALAEAVAKL